MKSLLSKPDSSNETARIEAFSDGVFAIVITLLVLEIKVPDEEHLKPGLLHALLELWPSYLAFFIGFFTILVCWVNHHYMFNRIHISSHTLVLANSALLFVVSFIPFPTAVLAETFRGGSLITAVQFYGLGYIFMALVYFTLSTFVYYKRDLTHEPEARRYRKAIKTMYSLSIVHTCITFVVIHFSILASLVLYVLLFSMFLFPIWYTNLILRIQNRKTGKSEIDWVK